MHNALIIADELNIYFERIHKDLTLMFHFSHFFKKRMTRPSITIKMMLL